MGNYIYNLYLFFPLPTSLSIAHPTYPIHMYSFINATDDNVNNTGIVPFSVGTSMPRAWTPLSMYGDQQGRLVFFYQCENGTSIQMKNLVGGPKADTGAIYNVLVNDNFRW